MASFPWASLKFGGIPGSTITAPRECIDREVELFRRSQAEVGILKGKFICLCEFLLPNIFLWLLLVLLLLVLLGFFRYHRQRVGNIEQLLFLLLFLFISLSIMYDFFRLFLSLGPPQHICLFLVSFQLALHFDLAETTLERTIFFSLFLLFLHIRFQLFEVIYFILNKI